jgi:hypothetical protein
MVLAVTTVELGFAVGPLGGMREASLYSATFPTLNGICFAKASVPSTFANNSDGTLGAAALLSGTPSAGPAIVLNADPNPSLIGGDVFTSFDFFAILHASIFNYRERDVRCQIGSALLYARLQPI